MSAIHTAHMTPEQIEEAKRLYGQGLNYKQVGDRLGFTGATIHRAIDPAYACLRRERINELRALARETRTAPPKMPRQAEIQIAAREELKADRLARLAEIPPDRRNLTQKICGDPLFERS